MLKTGAYQGPLCVWLSGLNTFFHAFLRFSIDFSNVFKVFSPIFSSFYPFFFKVSSLILKTKYKKVNSDPG